MQENIKEKSSNKLVWITGIIIMFFVVGFVTGGFGLFSHSATHNTTKTATSLAIGDSPVIGNTNAPVTIYEFSDFSCPYCGAAAGGNKQLISIFKSQNKNWQAPVPAIMRDYVQTGKIKFIFKSFQTDGQGQAAHEVGWCLNDQKLFWKFESEAFADQTNVASLDKMKLLAQSLDANMTQLNICLTSGKYSSQFKKDQQMGTANGVQATPTFFINGQKVKGAQSYSVFQKIISSKLNQ